MTLKNHFIVNECIIPYSSERQVLSLILITNGFNTHAFGLYSFVKYGDKRDTHLIYQVHCFTQRLCVYAETMHFVQFPHRAKLNLPHLVRNCVGSYYYLTG